MEYETYNGLFKTSDEDAELHHKIPYIPLERFHDFLHSIVNIVNEQQLYNDDAFKSHIQRFPLSRYVVFKDDAFDLHWDDLTLSRRCFLVALMIEDVVTKKCKPTITPLPSIWEFVDVECSLIKNETIFGIHCCWF